ncbi:TPA: nucleotidyltransferase [bacterium]|nr:nucleotidyltransferase [bacterium]
MINILIPLAGKSQFFGEEYPFPKPVIDIAGIPMIQLVLENFLKMKNEKKFIFILKEEDSRQYHIDNVVKLLTNNNCSIVTITGDTKGAACSALMAIDYINNDNELIIANGDQIIDADFDEFIKRFRDRNVDGGVICFESIHPKFSYVKLENDKIIETAEKKPISKNAIAGFYYFKKGSDFVKAAMKSIEDDASVNGLYFIAPTYNYLVLDNKNLEIIKIKNEQYHSFYSPQKIAEYEKFLESKK